MNKFQMLYVPRTAAGGKGTKLDPSEAEKKEAIARLLLAFADSSRGLPNVIRVSRNGVVEASAQARWSFERVDSGITVSIADHFVDAQPELPTEPEFSGDGA